jgi:hypothetical protein
MARVSEQLTAPREEEQSEPVLVADRPELLLESALPDALLDGEPGGDRAADRNAHGMPLQVGICLPGRNRRDEDRSERRDRHENDRQPPPHADPDALHATSIPRRRSGDEIAGMSGESTAKRDPDVSRLRIVETCEFRRPPGDPA